MGYEITHNEEGYQIKSTVSGEIIHKDKRITEEFAKSVFAEIALEEFLEKLIMIDKDFPHNYWVNGIRKHDHAKSGIRWLMDNPGKIEDEGQVVLNKLLGIDLELAANHPNAKKH